VGQGQVVKLIQKNLRGTRTLLHLINMSLMPQMGAALGCETLGEARDRKSKQSGEYWVRSKGGYLGMVANGRNPAVGMRNSTNGTFWDRVVNRTIGRGHE
jgi:hypothetical protein